MRVLILGAGSMGGLYAAALSRVCEVVAFDINQEHVDAINRDGLRLSGGLLDMVVELPATSRIEDVLREPFDYTIVAVKSTQTRAAVRSLKAALQRSVVVSIQNGIGNEEIIVEETAARVIQGVARNAAEVIGPGHIQVNRLECTFVGPFNCPLSMVQDFGELMERGGLKAEILSDVRPAVWSKLIMNSLLNPLTVVTGVAMADVCVMEPMLAFARSLIAECKAVADKLGIALEFDPEQGLKQFHELGVRHRGSMAHDIEARRPTEIDYLTGAIVREGEKVGVPTPACRTLARLLKGVEQARRSTESE